MGHEAPKTEPTSAGIVGVEAPVRRGMDLKFKVYGYLCAMELFEINGIAANEGDFGSAGDESPETAEDFACGNHVYRRTNWTEEVLVKYGITPDEYSEICDKLEDGLSFGCCGWCV
jgi:hypothetical protein